jgi:thymidylate synthase
MHVINAQGIDQAWVDTIKAVMAHGVKTSGIQEIPNLCINITKEFDASKKFDSNFRKIFGDERIDYASSVVFVRPEPAKIGNGYVYRQNDEKAKWNATYWGRMIRWQDKINQIEQALKRLRDGKNTKMISIAVYDPASDHKKVMGGIPCLTSFDIKPRDGKLYITAFFRSMRLSKSGYADIFAMCELGKFIAAEVGMTLHRITLITASGHIFYSGDEFKNSNKLLEVLGNGTNKSRDTTGTVSARKATRIRETRRLDGRQQKNASLGKDRGNTKSSKKSRS